MVKSCDVRSAIEFMSDERLIETFKMYLCGEWYPKNERNMDTAATLVKMYEKEILRRLDVCKHNSNEEDSG